MNNLDNIAQILPLSIIILAAGKGSRMGQAGPKVMQPIAGVPMVEHVVNFSREIQSNLNSDVQEHSTVAVIGPDMATLAQYLSSKSVETCVQSERLGTAHAVKIACESNLVASNGTILVLFGDTPLLDLASVSKLLNARKQADIAVCAFRTQDEGIGYGRLITDNKSVKAIVEWNDATSDIRKLPLCNAGIMAINSAIAMELLTKIDNSNAKGEYYLTDIVKHALGADYKVTYTEAPFWSVSGVNTPQDLANIEEHWQQNVRKKMLENGVLMPHPNTVISATNVTVEPGVRLDSHVVLEPGTHISAGAHIKSFSHICGAFIGTGASIGPYARLRPGTYVGENSKIGNFVETKNTQIGINSAASHLTYLGDAKIGSNVNIGAGTITCNYDGKNKHQTTIEDGAFIGSNTALIAPLTIDREALVGAGSAISQNVAEGQLSLTRSKQTERRRKK